ncbi:hypothetical protein [Sulfurimonas sp.]|uniref:hypothetical protein n=1 Tax=Sulfurimonas sp. TaxID=2022749 RepID=UPI002623C507|nr:hypothetical protein [Sulfurimonas sp.]
MSYISWFNEHANKHKVIVEKLVAKEYTKEQIIAYFDFEYMVKNEPDFCPLYAEHKKCHDMESLNCYLCACPNFRFKDKGIEKVEGKTKYSFCGINSKDGKVGVYGDAIHQDCSACSVPHHKDYVSKNFGLDWKKIMKKVIIS